MSSAEMAEPIDLPLGCGLERAEGNTSSTVFARWRQCACAQMRGPIGANWRIRLNRPSVAAVQSYVK